MALRATVQAVVDATTSASGTTAKATALVPPLVDVIIKEITRTYSLNSNQTEKIAVLRAELVTNIADFATSIG